MTLQFSISPDFNADQLSQWFIFNTWMQRTLERGIHFEPYDDFAALRAALAGAERIVSAASALRDATLTRASHSMGCPGCMDGVLCEVGRRLLIAETTAEFALFAALDGARAAQPEPPATAEASE